MKLRIISIDEIHPNPHQPRETFNKEALKELAESIKDVNIIQPIVVRQYGFTYQIIAGERRWRAAQIAGIKKIPCIIKEINDERVLLESLIENLHRKDLTDIERERAIYELWMKGNFETKRELAKSIGLSDEAVGNDVEAWEFRQKNNEISKQIPTYVISQTRGLEKEERNAIIKKVELNEIRRADVGTIAKIIRRGNKPVKKEILKLKSLITPRMAEIIVTKLERDEEQNLIVEEIKKSRLTEEEVEDRVREIQRITEMDNSLREEIEVKEGTTYIVSEYNCPYCKKHYVIKCDGKRDWVE